MLYSSTSTEKLNLQNRYTTKIQNENRYHTIFNIELKVD